MEHKYCRKFSQLNLSKIQINYALKASYCFLGVQNTWIGSRFSGTEMIQSKIVEMNATLN